MNATAATIPESSLSQRFPNAFARSKYTVSKNDSPWDIFEKQLSDFDRGANEQGLVPSGWFAYFIIIFDFGRR